MPYVHRVGDIFTTEMEAIGHGVNLDGAMFSGIAAIIAKRYPEVEKAYIQICENHAYSVGSTYSVYDQDSKIWILNLFSQDRPGANARLEWVEQSVREAVQAVRGLRLNGLALPRIGAGVGGLQWEEVKTILETVGAENLDVILEIWSLPNAE